MEATGSESLQHRLIIPTQQLPASLQHVKGSPTPQFLVGYRNVLVSSGQGVCWGLVKNEGYCGRAFVFEIGEQEATKIEEAKHAGEIIETEGTNYILLKIDSEISPPSDQLTSSQLQLLLDQLGGPSACNLNIVKNAFDSFSLYRLTAAQAVEQLQLEHKPEPEVEVGQQVHLQFNAKALSGAALLSVPVICPKTGKHLEGQVRQLKLQVG